MALFLRVRRTDPERVFVIAKNTEGSTLNADDCCMWEMSSASIDGVAVRQPDANNASGIVGIIDAAITNGAFGLVQVYGYRSSSRVLKSNTSMDSGHYLQASLGGAALSSLASSYSSDTNTTVTITNQPGPYFVLAETMTATNTSSTLSAKIFIRCL